MSCSVGEKRQTPKEHSKKYPMEKKTNYVAPVFPEAIGQFAVTRALFDSAYNKKVAAKDANRAEITYTLGMINLTEVAIDIRQNFLYIKNSSNIFIPYGEYVRNDDGSLVLPKVELIYKVVLVDIMSYLLYEKGKSKNYIYLLIEEIIEPDGSHMLNLVYGKTGAPGIPTLYAVSSKGTHTLPVAKDLDAFEKTLQGAINRRTIYEKASP
jgi:hypothetical protein